MSTRYEQAKAALDELITWYEEHCGDGDRNEDTTRLHLVDRLITDVLAWPFEEVRTEKYRDGEYVDYELGRPATRLIVEAKREANHFRLPVGMTSLIHRLPLDDFTPPHEVQFSVRIMEVPCEP